MIEFIVTSSVLIMVVILLRQLLKGEISLRLQYALWMLVLIRLVMPIPLPKSPISVMHAVPAVADVRQEQSVMLTSGTAIPDAVPDVSGSVGTDGDTAISTGGPANVAHGSFDWGLLARRVWYAGIGVLGLCFLLSNFALSKRLRKTRTAHDVEGCNLPIYLAEGLSSPCLFGVLRPTIYVTPEVLTDGAELRHVLAHEQAHYRHKDHIWSMVRCLCLSVHWYNPLVWLAAVLSRRDAELACDESAIMSLGEEHRVEYGRTLIGLTCERRSAMDLLCCGTTMTDGKRGITERITLIAKKPKTAIRALLVVLVVSALAVGCTFTGAGRRIQSPADEWFIAEAWQPAEGFARANSMAISKSDAMVTRHTDGFSVDVTFGESDGNRSVNVSFVLNADSGWAVMPANAVSMLDSGRLGWESEITLELQNDPPSAVIDYAKEFVAAQVEYYNELGRNPLEGGPGAYAIAEAKITGLTMINTGTAGLTTGVNMYLLEYRLRSDPPNRVVPVGGMLMEDIEGENWTTEWGSAGQPYLLLGWDHSGAETSWHRICVTNTDSIMQDYGTPEMLERYGNEFTAAAMELYRQSDAYQPVVTDTIAEVQKVYRLEERPGSREVREIAEALTTRLLNDLKKQEGGRTFTILDWEDLNLSADRMYDAWVVTGDVNVRYEGVLSPVGESDLLAEGEYVKVSLGERHLKNANGAFSLAPATGATPQAVLEPPFITSEMSIGIGVIPDYIDHKRVVFHGYFGLFVYDLEAEKISFSADLEKAVGTTIIQGSEGAAVRVNADGSTVQLYFYSGQTRPAMAYTVDTRTGDYGYGRYKPLDSQYTPTDSDYNRFSGGTLGELTYTDGQRNWLLFEGWDWAE